MVTPICEAASLIVQVIAVYETQVIPIKTHTTNQMDIKKMINRENLLMVSGEIKLMS